MSWKAQGWAIEQKTGSASNKWVLMVLSSFADENDACFPSLKTICKITELSKSTVIRCLKDLKRGGFIKIEERFTDINESKRQTSNLYTLNIGYQYETSGYHKETPPSITEKPHITNNKKPIYTEDFNEWWNLYPRKAGSKTKAFQIWSKIVDKELDIQQLYSFTVKYKQSIKDTDIKFIPHATTWLNGRRWETIEEANIKKVNLNQLVG